MKPTVLLTLGIAVHVYVVCKLTETPDCHLRRDLLTEKSSPDGDGEERECRVSLGPRQG